MKVTIKEIAGRAGVHPSTVDKVLHKRVGVSDAVRQRVQAIIDEVHYQPNLVGRALQKQGKDYTIAAILIEVDARDHIKAGIAAALDKHHELQIRLDCFTVRFDDAKAQAKLLQELIARKVDGIVLNPIYADVVSAEINKAQQSGIPVITITTDIESSSRMCYVGMDNRKAGRAAGRLMAKFIGAYGDVAIVTSSRPGNDYIFANGIRAESFEKFLQKEYPAIRIAEKLENFEDVRITYQKILQLLADHKNLRGIYLTSGAVAEVGRALIDAGRQDIVVISFEDYPQIIDLIEQGVVDCTLGSELGRQGELAVELVIAYWLTGKKPETDRLYTETRILIKEIL